MDIKDAKPTPGCPSRFLNSTACILPAGHAGRHRAALGTEWHERIGPTCSDSAWHPTYEDWVKERNDAVARADERDAYAKQVEMLTKERDIARADRDVSRSQRDLATERLHTAVTEVAVLRGKLEQAQQAADEWAAKAREYEHLFGPLMPVSGPVLRADDAVTQPSTPCPHSKAKQVGSSSFVVRRCKLADGHDGMCEPA